MAKKEIDKAKLKKLFRKANKQCNEEKCKEGDFLKSEATMGNIICIGCKIQGENFGQPMVMPENFVIASEKAKVNLQENPCKCCDGNWCLAEYGEPCTGTE